MTVDQKTTIAISDITGIEYDCGHCGATYTVPVKRFDRAVSVCPNCREEIVSATYKDSSKPNDQDILYNFVTKLKEVQERSLSVRLAVSLVRADDKTD